MLTNPHYLGPGGLGADGRRKGVRSKGGAGGRLPCPLPSTTPHEMGGGGCGAAAVLERGGVGG